MELAQVRVGRLDVVQVIHRLFQSIQHDFAMGSDLRVPHDGSYTVQISKFAEIALSPRVDTQYSVADKKRRILEPCIVYIKLFSNHSRCSGLMHQFISFLVLCKDLYLARAWGPISSTSILCQRSEMTLRSDFDQRTIMTASFCFEYYNSDCADDGLIH